MQRIDTYYLLIAAVINSIIFASLAWFNPLMEKTWAPIGSSLPVLSLWALRMEYFFLLFAVISLFLMVLSFMKRLPQKILMPLILALLLADIACLAVATFGYPMPFVSYSPSID